MGHISVAFLDNSRAKLELTPQKISLEIDKQSYSNLEITL